MVLDLFIIGLAITLGPLHNTAFILILTARRGVRKGLAFVLAWLACLVLVVAAVLLGTGGTPPRSHTAPSTGAEALKLAIGVAMIGYGEYRRRRRTGARAGQGSGSGVGNVDGRSRRAASLLTRLHDVSAWTAAGFGVLLQPWGLVAAGAATVVRLRLSGIASYLALLGFCLLATASILAMELYTAFAPQAAGHRLDAVRRWVEGHTDQAVVAISLVAGLWLVSKSIYQLVS
ncbi:GAP family protein [Kitasatospora sp. NBC_01287]|uniref:GAP family protein n=1 Tax=Kitasatospora sp. NBC_01287 TaxID=2903573 RepID=UPI00225896C1|nr:GAP family protein [Kitasatospora sp. NBC_01287]MCX4744057.1 GAP family protein [Kitasatospora sp. NBC_01287]